MSALRTLLGRCQHPPPLGPPALRRELSKCTSAYADNCALPGSCSHHPPAHPQRRHPPPPPPPPSAAESDIRRDFGYPDKYHAGSFPWLLSAERQRVPADDLDASAAGTAAQLLPRAARRRLAHALNMRIARGALGADAVDGVCAGAAAALPRVASLLSSASGGDAAAAGELGRIFTAPLLARYTADLARLRADSVHLALEVHEIRGARIHQLRTETGAAAALGAADAADAADAPGSRSLRAGLARQSLRRTSILGATHAAQRCAPAPSWPGAVLDAMGGAAPVRVRIDVELLVNMRYRLIGQSDGTSPGATIVDDDATRNLMLTLESNISDGAQALEWRVADIDYLLSSEQRIECEFVQARAADSTD